MHTRRDIHKALLSVPFAGHLLAAAEGVTLGVCTYSFRDIPRTSEGDAIGPVLDAMKACDAKSCELFSPQIEPENPLQTKFLQSIGKSPANSQELMKQYRAAMRGPEAKKFRDDLRQWRLSTPMSHFKAVRKRFDSAGVNIYAYTINFAPDYTEEEIGKCFEQAHAMGVKVIAASTKVSVLPKLKPMAEKYKIYVAVHGHSDVKHPDEFSSPETFQKALDMSEYFRVNLDIGHFAAAGFDPMAYINEHHARITHLHIKDRQKDDGPNKPFGEGDTPIKPVLALLKEKKYKIPAFVEYEYKGTDKPVAEVKKCLAYMRESLA